MANGSACCCPDLKIRPMPAQFSNGCAIGCDSCDGTSRGPLPGEKNGSSWRGCSKRDASGEWMAKCNLCPEKNVSATICDPKLRTINSQAPCGSPTDYYYYSPWRAPYAPAHLPRCPQPEPAPPPVRITLHYIICIRAQADRYSRADRCVFPPRTCAQRLSARVRQLRAGGRPPTASYVREGLLWRRVYKHNARKARCERRNGSRVSSHLPLFPVVLSLS